MNISDKLQKIQALLERTEFGGERQAAQEALQRMQNRIEMEKEEKPIEYRVSSHSIWEKKLFVAYCRKYGLKPFRYARQRYTTTMVEVSPRFMETVLFPEYQQTSSSLRETFEQIAQEIVLGIDDNEEEETVVQDLLPEQVGMH